MLVYGLNRGVDDGWTSPSTVAVFVAAAILLAGFVRVESHSRAPLVPFAALRNRTMVASDLAAFLLFGAFFSFIFLASLLMQQLLQYSPTRTGVAWLATSITAFVAAGITGARLVGRFGVKRLLVAGLTLGAVGMALLTRIEPGTHYADLLPAFVLAGLAIGMSAPSVQIGALTGVAPQTVGLASGLVETMREIGGAVGIAAAATVLASRSSDAEARHRRGAGSRALRCLPVGVHRHVRLRRARRTRRGDRLPTAAPTHAGHRRAGQGARDRAGTQRDRRLTSGTDGHAIVASSRDPAVAIASNSSDGWTRPNRSVARPAKTADARRGAPNAQRSGASE